MDSACYASTDNLIIGVRGSRVYKCSAVDGSVITSFDYQQFSYGPASIVYDVGTGRCFATCATAWSFDTGTGFSLRNVVRIIPASLTPDLTIASTTFFNSLSMLAGFWAGPAVIKNIGGVIYGLWINDQASSSNRVFRFQASNPAVNAQGNIDSEYPSFAYASVGGNDRIVGNGMSDQTVQWYDFTAASFTQGPADLRNRMSIEFAPVQSRFYCPEQAQFIDVYDDTGTFVLQLDTSRSNFNGVNIAFNSVDGLLYAAGGADNSVVVINPATNAFTVKLGFDLPCGFVFTPLKKFAVQSGAVGLKEVI